MTRVGTAGRVARMAATVSGPRARHSAPMAAVAVAPFTARYIDRLVSDPGLRERLKDPSLARPAVRQLHRLEEDTDILPIGL